MTTTWILVANSSSANLLVNSGPHTGLQLVKQFTHPESREKASELVSDRPGHIQGHGGGHGSYIPAMDPKHNEAEHFAQALAHELEQGRVANSYTRLIIVASRPFVGMLNSRLDEQVRNLVSDTLEKDYTHATIKELGEHLEQFLLQ